MAPWRSVCVVAVCKSFAVAVALADLEVVSVGAETFVLGRVGKVRAWRGNLIWTDTELAGQFDSR